MINNKGSHGAGNMDLATKKCIPCETGTPPMSKEEAEKYLAEINKTRSVIPAKAGIQQSAELWILDQVENDKSGKALKIRKRFKFANYLVGVDFVDKVAQIAEGEGHHPDIFLGWRRVTVNLATHAIGGLSQNDFIMAAKIDKLL